jgi:hypothetical protein
MLYGLIAIGIAFSIAIYMVINLAKDKEPISDNSIELEKAVPIKLKYPTWALIVGNSSTNPNTYGSENKLAGVSADLKRVHKYLCRYGSIKNSRGETLGSFFADTMNNALSTSTAYLEAIKKIADQGKKVSGKKMLIIYESGHGSQVKALNDDDQDKMAETRVFYDRMLVDDETRTYIMKTLGSDWQVLNIVDRCHSGGLARGISAKMGSIKMTDGSQAGINKAIVPITVDNGLAILKVQSAAKEGTYAYDNGEIDGGMFTRFYFDKLNELNGNIDYNSLNKYAQKQCGKKQVPELQDASGSDIFIWDNTLKFLN